MELNSKQYAVHNEFRFTITIIILLFTNQVSVREGSMVHVELMALQIFYAH